jgi:nucleoside-diphosphate-sugar epimerase
MQSLEQPGARFLLSGASGLLGTAVRNGLLHSGAEVLQLVRRPPLGPREVQWFPERADAVPAATGLEGLAAAIRARMWRRTDGRRRTAGRCGGAGSGRRVRFAPCCES